MDDCCQHLHEQSHLLSRRGFIRLTGLGTAAALFAAWAPSTALAGGKAEALLLSCMDFRLLDHMASYMHDRGLDHEYDHVILAGASLGASFSAEWSKTFWDHLDLAQKLHGVGKLIVLDHRDCGAYKLKFGAEHAADPKLETATHAKVLTALGLAVREKHPNLAVELLLMDLEGKVEAIA